MKTKDKILEAALAQFNESGSSRVTTNHIAEAMGISPGNLYYHYRNKEAIILRLWEKMVDEIDIPFYDEFSVGQAPDLIRFLHEFFSIAYKYRFFWLEIGVLLERDPELREKYTSRARHLLTYYKTAVRKWQKTGFLRPNLKDEDFDQMIDDTWFLTQFWALNTYIHEDRITVENMKAGARRIVNAIKPYLSPEAVDAYDKAAETIFFE